MKKELYWAVQCGDARKHRVHLKPTLNGAGILCFATKAMAGLNSDPTATAKQKPVRVTISWR